MRKNKFLIVAQQESLFRDLQEKLNDINYQNIEFLSYGKNILTKIQAAAPDIILIDDGSKQEKKKIEIARKVHEQLNIPVVVLSTNLKNKSSTSFYFEQSIAFVEKSADTEELKNCIESVLSTFELDLYLKQNSLWFSAFIKTLTEAVVVVDKLLNVNFMNSAAEQLTGLNSSQAKGNSITTILNLNDRANEKKIVSRLKLSVSNGNNDNDANGTIALNINGHPIHKAYQIFRIKNPEQNPVGIILKMGEIEDREKIEQSLQESEEKFKSLAEHSPNMIFINQKGKVVYANEMCEEIMGYTRQEFYADSFNFFDLIAPEDKKMVEELYHIHLKGEDIPPYEYGLVTKDGRKIEVIISSKIIDYDGEKAILGIVTDITERKNAELALQQSEERYRAITEVITDYVYTVHIENGDVVKTVHGPACVAVTGYTPADFEADPNLWLNMVVEEDRNLVQNQITQIFNEENFFPIEHRLQRKDGSIRWVRNTPVLHHNKTGNLISYDGLIQDITERKLAEEALRDNIEFSENIIQTAGVIILTLDEHANILEFNKYASELTGYLREEVIGKNWFDTFIPEENRIVIKKIFKDVFFGQNLHWGNENEILCREGDRKIISWHNSLLRDKDEHTIAVLSIGNDITARKQTETFIKRRLEFEKTMGRLSSRFVGVFNMDEAINQSLLELGEISGASRVYLFLLRDSGAKMDNTHEWCAEGVSPQIKNLQNLPSDSFPWWIKKLNSGEFIHVQNVDQMPDEAQSEKEILKSQSIKSLLVFPIKVKYDLFGFLGFDNVINTQHWKDEDILLLKVFSEILGNAYERKSAEEQSQALFRRNQALLEALPDDILIFCRDGTFIDYKLKQDEHAFGAEEIMGKNIRDVGLSENNIQLFLHGIEEAIDTGEVQTIEYEIKTNIGLGYFEVRIARLSQDEAIANVRNVTERKRLENELIKTEKLESLGVMAGGIAHDFNNLMTAIVGNISLAKLYEGKWDKILDRLNAAENASFRAKDLTQQLLTFAKGGEPIKKTVSINKLIKDSINLALSGSNVISNFTLEDDLYPVEVDESQIHQVIHNLAINAIQAMPQGGQLDVKGENVKLEGDSSTHQHNDNYVKISIKDYGIGILQEHLPKIFDPYFTTKQKGSGLGLASAYSIIRKHDGYMEVESEIAKGTTFHLFLPASVKKIDADKRKELNVWKGSGKVLLMDDEEIVREIAKNILNDMGFQVEEAKNGEEAIKLYKRTINTSEPFRLVIMDLTVPGGMGGKEAIKALIQIDPKVKAVVSSGYSTDDVMADYRNYGFLGVIKKPFTVQEFSDVLERILKNPENSK